MVLNLIVNALESMDAQGTLRIDARYRQGMAEIVFSDDGCGMEPEILENIFEPFFTRRREGKGTGLGLSITHRIISQHDGEIMASSPGTGPGIDVHGAAATPPAEIPEEGRPRPRNVSRRHVEPVPAGSSDRLAVDPAAVSDNSEPQRIGRARDMEKSRQGGLRILYADDESHLRDLMQMELPRLGHEVTVCPDGTAALRALERGLYDAALLDLRMPGLTGIEVLGQIRQISPETQVIILTGHATVNTAVQALRLGAFDYLTKPCKWAELEVILTRVAERRDMANKAVALETRLKAAEGSPLLIGETPVMQQVRRLIETIAPTDASVMILGETGTGKELVARSLHDKSRRPTAPSFPSIAEHCPRTWSRASSSATGKVPSPVPTPIARDFSRWPTEERCSSTKWASWTRAFRSSSCGSWNRARSAASARMSHSGSMCACSAPRIAICATWSPANCSAKTCSSGSIPSRSTCPRCATQGRHRRLAHAHARSLRLTSRAESIDDRPGIPRCPPESRLAREHS